MTYTLKPLACDPTRIKGMSEKLIVSHYENNYGGAVNRLNGITAQLAELDFTAAPGFVVNGLKREELIAGGSPILALDMYEHSYHIDYGARAAAYVDAFMAAINWGNVGRAYGEVRS